MYTLINYRFDKYDINKDGGISPKEFRQLCADMGYFLTPAEIELDLKLLDTDGNGSIGFPECT
jgi:Ca2+-binding EF-hand superfamily protein